MSTHEGRLAWVILVLIVGLVAAFTVQVNDQARESGTSRAWVAVFALGLTGSGLWLWAGLTKLVYLYAGTQL